MDIRVLRAQPYTPALEGCLGAINRGLSFSLGGLRLEHPLKS